MGEVWLAEQSRPLQRRVALKLIKAGMDTGPVIARFDAERQALALMDHPNIAKVFDAGATPEGRPYFVMEYVKGDADHRVLRSQPALGTRTASHCSCRSARAFSTPTRKASFIATSSRRTSSSTEQDDRRAPKIIDFGVAKATTTLSDRTRVHRVWFVDRHASST